MKIHHKPHADKFEDENVEPCFQKVIEVIDSMRTDELITYSSGHKHVDALIATKGDPSMLLAMDSEIQRHPQLLIAFGNSRLIWGEDESLWYKTFGDYNPDIKPLAVKRHNFMIDLYNEKLASSRAEKSGRKDSSDSEKKDRLKQFSHFYSQFVHMTTIQTGLGCLTDDYMEKYMAMSLLHITGANKVKELSTLEFRFFRCAKTVEEVKLINQFLQALFRRIHHSAWKK